MGVEGWWRRRGGKGGVTSPPGVHVPLGRVCLSLKTPAKMLHPDTTRRLRQHRHHYREGGARGAAGPVHEQVPRAAREPLLHHGGVVRRRLLPDARRPGREGQRRGAAADQPGGHGGGRPVHRQQGAEAGVRHALVRAQVRARAGRRVRPAIRTPHTESLRVHARHPCPPHIRLSVRAGTTSS